MIYCVRNQAVTLQRRFIMKDVQIKYVTFCSQGKEEIHYTKDTFDFLFLLRIMKQVDPDLSILKIDFSDGSTVEFSNS